MKYAKLLIVAAMVILSSFSVAAYHNSNRYWYDDTYTHSHPHQHSSHHMGKSMYYPYHGAYSYPYTISNYGYVRYNAHGSSHYLTGRHGYSSYGKNYHQPRHRLPYYDRHYSHARGGHGWTVYY